MTPRLSGVFVLYVNGILSRASSKPWRSRVAFRRPPTPDTSRVSLARTLPAVWKKCAVHVRHPERSKRRAVHAASHLCRETRPASSFRVTRTSRSRRTWSSRRPSSLPAPSPRASARARATAPPRFARHRAPRASSPAAEPVRAPRISDVRPRRRRVDVERDPPFDRSPRAREGAPRPADPTARGGRPQQRR